MTKTFRMTLDTTEHPAPKFMLAADGHVVLWAYNHEAETPMAISGTHPQTRAAALRRWSAGLRSVMNKYAQTGFMAGAHSVAL